MHSPLNLSRDQVVFEQSISSDTLSACLSTSPSSRGLGHRPFTAVTRVRTPLGALGRERNLSDRK